MHHFGSLFFASAGKHKQSKRGAMCRQCACYQTHPGKKRGDKKKKGNFN
jgi:hypothetical protein